MRDSGLFEQNYLETLINHHQSGRRDYSSSIWTLLMFEFFCEKVKQYEQPVPEIYLLTVA